MGLSASESLDRILAVLADPNRRQVVDLLSRHPMRAGDLAEATGLSPQAMSRHLRVLRESELVEEARDGVDARVRFYVLRSAPMKELKRWLEETDALWTEQLLLFRTLIESGD